MLVDWDGTMRGPISTEGNKVIFMGESLGTKVALYDAGNVNGECETVGSIKATKIIRFTIGNQVVGRGGRVYRRERST